MARLANAVGLALTQLRRNWTRSLLTSLGVLIGVAAVIAMVGLGQGARASIEDDLSDMGTNLLMIESGTGGGPQARSPAPPFDLNDIRALERQVPYIRAVAPMVSSRATAQSGGIEWNTKVQGSTRGFLVARDWDVAVGRGFTDGEERTGAAVCVLGATVHQALFEGLDPLGAQVRFGAVSCDVIGVLDAKGTNTMGMDQDDLIFVPLSLVQRRLIGTTDLASILVSIDDVAHVDVARGSMDQLLRSRRHVTSDETVNFQIRDTRRMASMVRGVTNTLTAFLAAIASVSLLVGGIGIMNIMLVSVTERTREIGIRMSIGALEGDVMMQFLVEAVVLSLFGGGLGVGLGIVATAALATALAVPIVVDPAIVALSLTVSAVLGVVFGWWPARRAARLEPIDALRHT
ncbi:MAG: ABC transporter permease [Myxococcota bacterium]